LVTAARRRRFWADGRLCDDLDSVGECHTESELWQLVVAIETAPAFLQVSTSLKTVATLKPANSSSGTALSTT
jgi:hypothetical protein